MSEENADNVQGNGTAKGPKRVMPTGPARSVLPRSKPKANEDVVADATPSESPVVQTSGEEPVLVQNKSTPSEIPGWAVKTGEAFASDLAALLGQDGSKVVSHYFGEVIYQVGQKPVAAAVTEFCSKLKTPEIHLLLRKMFEDEMSERLLGKLSDEALQTTADDFMKTKMASVFTATAGTAFDRAINLVVLRNLTNFSDTYIEKTAPGLAKQMLSDTLGPKLLAYTDANFQKLSDDTIKTVVGGRAKDLIDDGAVLDQIGSVAKDVVRGPVVEELKSVVRPVTKGRILEVLGEQEHVAIMEAALLTETPQAAKNAAKQSATDLAPGIMQAEFEKIPEELAMLAKGSAESQSNSQAGTLIEGALKLLPIDTIASDALKAKALEKASGAIDTANETLLPAIVTRIGETTANGSTVDAVNELVKKGQKGLAGKLRRNIGSKVNGRADELLEAASSELAGHATETLSLQITTQAIPRAGSLLSTQLATLDGFAEKVAKDALVEAGKSETITTVMETHVTREAPDAAKIAAKDKAAALADQQVPVAFQKMMDTDFDDIFTEIVPGRVTLLTDGAVQVKLEAKADDLVSTAVSQQDPQEIAAKLKSGIDAMLDQEIGKQREVVKAAIEKRNNSWWNKLFGVVTAYKLKNLFSSGGQSHGAKNPPVNSPSFGGVKQATESSFPLKMAGLALLLFIAGFFLFRPGSSPIANSVAGQPASESVTAVEEIRPQSHVAAESSVTVKSDGAGQEVNVSGSVVVRETPVLVTIAVASNMARSADPCAKCEPILDSGFLDKY